MIKALQRSHAGIITVHRAMLQNQRTYAALRSQQQKQVSSKPHISHHQRAIDIQHPYRLTVMHSHRCLDV